MLSNFVTGFCMAALVTGGTKIPADGLQSAPVRPSSQAAAASDSLRVGELQGCVGSLEGLSEK